jgi:aspartate-semialdehyde dehydrogenase
MSKTFNIAVVGATGVVGEAILEILKDRKFPVGNIYALASERSAGNPVNFGNSQLIVEDLADFDFSKVQIGLFSAGGSISEEFAPKAAAAGCVVIDNTSHFRYDDDIPLVVPEVNPEAIGDYSNRGIIANPNCSTIQMVVALKPIYDAVGIERINVCTYQAVSGAGRPADTLEHPSAYVCVQGLNLDSQTIRSLLGGESSSHRIDGRVSARFFWHCKPLI